MTEKSTSPVPSEFCTEPAVPGDKMEGLSLLTDLYQLTMAQGYWKSGRANTQAVFHVFYRTQPFNGGYSICSGLEPALQWLHALRFTKSDIDYLATLNGNDGKPLFDRAFLDYLISMGPLSLDIDAVPEGTVVFPFEPLVRVKGPILQAQLVETALLCMINFGTLVATKAARICASCQGEPVLEFGFRRAQGLDGALTASRAAYIGGCAATSNVLAGKRYGIPVAGTHAHSWVQSFPSQQEAFDHWAETAPNNCVLLVDTYDTLTGVRDAIKTAKKLVERGYKFAGILLTAVILLGSVLKLVNSSMLLVSLMQRSLLAMISMSISLPLLSIRVLLSTCGVLALSSLLATISLLLVVYINSLLLWKRVRPPGSHASS